MARRLPCLAASAYQCMACLASSVTPRPRSYSVPSRYAATASPALAAFESQWAASLSLMLMPSPSAYFSPSDVAAFMLPELACARSDAKPLVAPAAPETGVLGAAALAICVAGRAACAGAGGTSAAGAGAAVLDEELNAVVAD